MSKFFVKDNQINGNVIKIEGTDVNHIRNVLRAEIGNKIEVCNTDRGQSYFCKVTDIEKEYIECNIIEEIKFDTEPKVKVTIFQGIPKAEKMELIIQKSVELGVENIVPVEMKRCIVKLKDECKKLDRWQKISEVAAKQCGRNKIPKVKLVINVENICNLVQDYDIVLLAYENEQKNTLKNEIQEIKKKINNYDKEEIKIGVIIGPEGGIEKTEKEKLEKSGVKSITLGKRILRTETVALNILSILMYELEDIGGDNESKV